MLCETVCCSWGVNTKNKGNCSYTSYQYRKLSPFIYQNYSSNTTRIEGKRKIEKTRPPVNLSPTHTIKFHRSSHFAQKRPLNSLVNHARSGQQPDCPESPWCKLPTGLPCTNYVGLGPANRCVVGSSSSYHSDIFHVINHVEPL